MVVSFGVDAVKCAKTFWELEDTFEKKGIGFKSVTEPFDTTTAMGRGFWGCWEYLPSLRETLALNERKKPCDIKKKRVS